MPQMSGRILPRTPGSIIAPQPPAKPRRKGAKKTSGTQKKHLAAGDSNFSNALLKNIKESNEEVSFVASCIAKEFLNTDTYLKPEDVNALSKLLEETAEDNPEIITDFLDSYFLEKNQKVNECCWDSIIELYVALLKISLGEALVVYTCVQALYTLSLMDNTVSMIHRLETTPVLLGVISAHMRNHSILEKPLLLLARLTKFPLQDGLKIVVKETGVDILLKVLDTYSYSSVIVVPILRALANTLSTINSNTAVAQEQNDGDLRPLASLQDSLLKQSAVLEYMDQHGRSRVETLLQKFPTDLGVQVEGHRFLFLGRHPARQVKKMRRMSAQLQMLQPRSILRSEPALGGKRVSFFTIALDSDDEEESSDIELDARATL